MSSSIVQLSRVRSSAAVGAMIALILTAWYGAKAHKPIVVRTLVETLENRIERTKVSDWSEITGIVVLGGNIERIGAAMQLARERPHLRIVLSSQDPLELALAHNAVGISPHRLLIESQSFNTFGNATQTKALIRPQAGERWLLVTSASHMPRAIGSFYRVGFFVEPWPVRDAWRSEPFLTHVARHEWLGLMAYWVRGRTISVFPSAAELARWAPRRAELRT